MRDWKLLVYFSGGAAVLSVLAGIAGGVSLTGIIVRALAGGAFFGVLAFFLSRILHTYLPEIYGSSSESTGEEVPEEGSDRPGVDIVIDDDLESEAGPGTEIPQEMHSADDAEDVSVLPEEEENDGEDLPNIERFSEMFDKNVDTADEKSALTGSVSVDIMGQEQDPGTVAKAIRTIMKKDQEG